MEAPPELEGHLRTLAESVGYRVITLTAGTRAIYHVSTNYSASFLLSLLREACDIWNGFGVSDEDALTALLPLARGALKAAGAKGLAGAIAGPISRGDLNVVRAHLGSFKGIGDDAVEFYRVLAHRQIRLARDKGELNAEIISRLEEAIDS